MLKGFSFSPPQSISCSASCTSVSVYLEIVVTEVDQKKLENGV
jgi:hypothetical protein